MRRHGPNYDEAVHASLRVQAPLGGGKALHLGALRLCRLDMREYYKGREPLCQRMRVAYIECARTLSDLRYTGFNVS